MDLANERIWHPSHVEAARLSGALSGGGCAGMPGHLTQTSLLRQDIQGGRTSDLSGININRLPGSTSVNTS